MQSDALERRFSWYRQSSGANYYISVLQILQSKKVIRTRSLIDQGFNMKDVQVIFDAVNNSGQTDTDESALSEHGSVRSENIQVHIETHSEDRSIIYYVAGSIARAILKKTKCEMCTELLSAAKMEVQSINFDCIDARQEFISDVSRDGLLKPSDVVYITCMHAFVIYKSIKVR